MLGGFEQFKELSAPLCYRQQKLSVEAGVHLSGGTECPPLCTERAKLQGISTFSSLGYMSGVWDRLGF